VANHPDGYGVINERVVIFHRYGPGVDGKLERFIVVINFADDDRLVDIPFSANGEWQDLLNGEKVHVAGFRLFKQRIPSNWGCIYYHETRH
jgi:hypothetical protein